jgi:hypothetical protein
MKFWYEMMTEEKILPSGVSWREFADHCLTHDPLPGEHDGGQREMQGVQAQYALPVLHLHSQMRRCTL